MSIQEYSYDFEDITMWSKFLVEAKKKEQKVVDENSFETPLEDCCEDEENEQPIPEMYLDMPVSWVPEMHITSEGQLKKIYFGADKTNFVELF